MYMHITHVFVIRINPGYGDVACGGLSWEASPNDTSRTSLVVTIRTSLVVMSVPRHIQRNPFDCPSVRTCARGIDEPNRAPGSREWRDSHRLHADYILRVVKRSRIFLRMKRK